jgi:hypothetical protein
LAQATELDGERGAIIDAGDLSYATREVGEPMLGCGDSPGYSPQGSIWYRWQAPRTVAAIFRVPGGGSYPGIDLLVFEDDAFSSPIGESRRVINGHGRRVIFNAVGGSVYYLSVVNCRDSPGGLINLDWAFAGAGPPNDLFEFPQDLAGMRGRVLGDNATATPEFGEPPIPVDGTGSGVSGDQTLWYRWTAPETGIWAFTTDGVVPGSGQFWPLDTIVAVYTGNSLTDLDLIASDDDFITETNFLFSRVILPAESGQTYKLTVTGYNENIGQFFLNWAPVPSNDSVEQAQDIGGSVGSVDGNNLGASVEVGEPDAGDWVVPGGLDLKDWDRTIWYRWTAPYAGRWTFDALQATFNTSLGIYSGENLADLQPRALNNDAQPYPGYFTGCADQLAVYTGVVAFEARMGEPYAIVLGSGNSGTTDDPVSSTRGGFTTLSWRPTPENDDLDGAQEITGVTGSISFSTEGATPESRDLGAPDSLGGASVWFRWNAPVDAPATFQALADQRIDLQVWVGSALTDLRLVGRVPPCIGFGTVEFPALAGQTYFVSVATRLDEWGPVTLSWSAPPFTPTPTDTPTDTPTPTATSTMIPCVGDCGGTRTVVVNDIITLVNIALGNAQPSACPKGIPSGAQVDVALIIRAVNSALSGCP